MFILRVILTLYDLELLIGKLKLYRGYAKVLIVLRN